MANVACGRMHKGVLAMLNSSIHKGMGECTLVGTGGIIFFSPSRKSARQGEPELPN